MAVSMLAVESKTRLRLLDQIADNAGLEIVPRFQNLYAVIDSRGNALAESGDLTCLEFYIHGYRQARGEVTRHKFMPEGSGE